jgi:hypothetical protein
LILIVDARRREFMDGAVLRHGLQLTLRQGRNPAQSASAEPSSATVVPAAWPPSIAGGVGQGADAPMVWATLLRCPSA